MKDLVNAWFGKSLLGTDSWMNSPDYHRYMGIQRTINFSGISHKKKAQRKAQRQARRRNRK